MRRSVKLAALFFGKTDQDFNDHFERNDHFRKSRWITPRRVESVNAARLTAGLGKAWPRAVANQRVADKPSR